MSTSRAVPRGRTAGAAGALIVWTLLLSPRAGWSATAPLILESASPAVVMGRDESADLVVKGPLDPRDLHVSCNAGSVRSIKRVSPQEARAEFVPPRTGEPNWALCAAVSGSAHATAVIPLLRREMLPVAKLPPLSRVEVRIRDAVYGPVRANADGSAEVAVLLPPNVKEAVVAATPAGQATLTRSMALSVRPTDQVLVLTPAFKVVADGTSTVPLWVFSANDRGELADLPLTTSSAEGTIAVQPVAAGVATGTFQPYARSDEGEATIAVRGPSGRTSSIRLTVEGGVHPRVELRSPVHGLPADGVTSVNLEATVTDEQGHPLSGQPLKVAATVGTVSQAVERRPGVYSVSYTAPAEPGPRSVVTAELAGGARSEVTLALAPPPRVTVEASPRQALGDGQSHVVLTITARGPDGRKLPDGSKISLSTSRGVLPTEVATVDGRAEAELAVGTTAGEAEIEARALDAFARTTVRILPGAPTGLLVHPLRTTVRCDGTDAAEVRLRVVDAHQNAVEGVPVDVHFVAAGKAVPASRLRAGGPGEFFALYRPERGCEGGPVAVLAEAATLSGSAQLWVQRDNVDPLALLASLGGQSAFQSELSSLFEVEGARAFNVWQRRLWAALSVQVLRGSAWGVNGGDLWSLGVYLGPKLDLVRTDRFGLFAGAGADAHLVRLGPALLPGAVWGGTLGAHVRLGTSLVAGPGAVVLQARYELAQWETAPGLAASARGLSALLGYRMTF